MAPSTSELEWGIAMARLERGEPVSDVEKWLADHAYERRGTDARRYAHYTVAKACRTIAARCQKGC